MCLCNSHGQLGHGGLTSEEEPRVVEALWGMPMTHVATGGWHSACISGKCQIKIWTSYNQFEKDLKRIFLFLDGGDLYVWGWNESGQLGLPSRGLRKSQQKTSQQTGLSWNVHCFKEFYWRCSFYIHFEPLTLSNRRIMLWYQHTTRWKAKGGRGAWRCVHINPGVPRSAGRLFIMWNPSSKLWFPPHSCSNK